MYGALCNITPIVDTFVKMLKLKGSKGAIEDVYALLYIFLS